MSKSEPPDGTVAAGFSVGSAFAAGASSVDAGFSAGVAAGLSAAFAAGASPPMSKSDPPAAGSAFAGAFSSTGSVFSACFAAGFSAGVSKRDDPEVSSKSEPPVPSFFGSSFLASGVSKRDEPPLALASGPASSVATTVSSVRVTSSASGSAWVASSFFLAAGAAAFAVPGLALVATSPFTDASSIWATSRTSTSSRASPLSCWAVRPSLSMTRQKGQPTAIWSAPVPTASLVRFRLMRSPMFSSIHMRAPPAPQQKERSLLRSISANSAPGMIWSSSRGGSYTWLWRPR